MRSSPARILACSILGITAIAGSLCSQVPDEGAPDIKALRVRLEAQYAQLLEDLAKNAIDLRRHGLQELIGKQKAIDEAVHRFADQTIATMVDPYAIGIDVVRFVAATSPRLTGRIVKIGRERDQQELRRTQIQPGDLIILAPGDHELPEGAELRDVLLMGSGRERTTLRGHAEIAERVQFESLTWECENSPCLDLGRGGSARVVDCLIRGYNSGRGGSNAVFGIDAILLIENCLFEGMSGDRDGPDSNGGDAFDLRLNSYLYVRNSRFVDNGEVIRTRGLCSFDNCVSTHRLGSEQGITPQPGGTVLLRKNRVALASTAGTRTFEHATDDRKVIDHLLRSRSKLDPETQEAINALGLRQSLRYWATLLRNVDRSIQSSARARLKKLLPTKLPKASIDRKATSEIPSALRARIVAALQSSNSLRWLEEIDDGYEWDAQHGYYVPKKKR